METRALRGLGLTALMTISMLIGVSGATTASAGYEQPPTGRPSGTGQVSGQKIMVTVWDNGVKAGSAGSGGGRTVELPMPVPCWLNQSVYTGKTYYEYVKSAQMAEDNKHHGTGKPDDDIAELLVGLFDAIMLTWRWRPGLTV